MVKVGTINLTPEQRKRTFHLPVEQAVFVPSTSGVKTQTRISPAKLNQRVNNVRRFLSKKFGGFTDVQATGGFVLKNGRLVKERVIKVTAFATKSGFKKNEGQVINQVGTWGRKWKQESVSYSNEGDLFIIEPSKNGSPKIMRRVLPSKKLRKVIIPRLKQRVRRTITPAQRRVMLSNLAKARRTRRK